MADKFELVVEIPLVMPDYRFDKQMLTEMGQVIEATTVANVLDQTQLDRTPIKRNPPGYREYKRKKGWGNRSLVAKDKSLTKKGGRSFKGKTSVSGRSVTVAPVPGKAADRTESVQEKGYTGWFGINDKAVELIKAVIAKFIRRSEKKARAKAGRG